MVNATPWPLYYRETDPIPIAQEAGWAPGHCATNRNVAGSILDAVLNFSATWSFRSHYGPVVDSTSNRNEYQNLPWGKGGRCVGLTTLPHSCTDYLDILGTSISHKGLSRCVMGQLYLACFLYLFLVSLIPASLPVRIMRLFIYSATLTIIRIATQTERNFRYTLCSPFRTRAPLLRYASIWNDRGESCVLEASHNITQYYTFPQFSHAAKTTSNKSIFTHTGQTKKKNKQ